MDVSTVAIEELNEPSLSQRQKALASLVERGPSPAPEEPWVNMHMHTFYSFNGEGWSPTRLAWEAKRMGLYAAGIVDFDVLDGLTEFYSAADFIGLRGTVGFESRTFFKEYADHEINSPGEPGVFYFTGVGFKTPPEPSSTAAGVFNAMLDQSHARNRAMIARINQQLGTIAIHYEDDVLPLTPAKNATERHIVKAYYDRGLTLAGGDLTTAAKLWAKALSADVAETTRLIDEFNAFADFLRAKLMKKGGLGYVQPTDKTFPPLDEVIGMILDCQAVPASAWLDGTSSGEANPSEQLECLLAKGVAAANIVPDRNWNVKPPDKAARLVEALHTYADICRKMDIPILVGTELNKPGQRFVDDFSAPPMKPLHEQFLFGAQVMVGHTRLLRHANFSYVGAAAVNEYPTRGERNRAFAAIGALPAPPSDIRMLLAGLAPDKAFGYLQDCAKKVAWLQHV